MLRILACVAVIFALTYTWGQEVSLEEARRALEEASRLAQSLNGTLSEPKDPEMEQKAREAVRAFEAQKQLVDKYVEELTRGITGSSRQELLKQEASGHIDTFLPPGEALLVFISSSVPDSTVRRYMEDLEALGDPRAAAVMRGFVEGMKRVRPTLEYAVRILKKDPSCDHTQVQCPFFEVSLDIDPIKFRLLRITAVPAVAYVKGLDPLGLSCESEGVEAWVVYGDVSLEWALEAIYRASQAESVRMLLNKLRGRGYYAGGRGK